MPAIQSIVHPTDFSEASAEAFAHALRVTLAAKGRLTVLHVSADARTDDWAAFPHVRQLLADWGLMDANDPPDAIAAKAGITVSKVEMMPHDPVDAVARFIGAHPADLIVLATEGRQGVARWLSGSVAEALARQAKVPTLFVPAKARGFVDRRRGEVHLRHVLIPVDREPKPAAAVSAVMSFAHMLAGIDAEPRLLHIGKEPPQVQHHTEPGRALPVALRQGDVLDAILDVANDWPADLIGMATAGHRGVLDALRGSTTERVLRQAPCPLLAVPVER